MQFIEIILSLLTLVLLEIVLGIDNLIFLSILTARLPKEQRKLARRFGLSLAWITRLLLLFSALWIVRLKKPLFSLLGHDFSFRNLFLLAGGIFLVAKATQEIHQEVTHTVLDAKHLPANYSRFWPVVIQVSLMDIIFSLDSILTAIGLTTNFWVMAVAITLAILVMIYASEPVSHFIEKYPTIKMLGLSFLIMIGMLLIADGFSVHVPREYLYFALGFSLAVEGLQVLKQAKQQKGKS